MSRKVRFFALALACLCLLSACAQQEVQPETTEEKEVVTFEEPEIEEKPEAVIVEDTPTEEKIDERFVNISQSMSYLDPAGRFTVTMPEIFTDAPEEAQSDDSVYLQNADGSAYISVTVIDKSGISAEDYIASLNEDYGILAAQRPDGLICWSDRFTDGFNDPWAQFFYIKLLDSCTVQVEYVFREENMELCKPGCDIISIA